MLYLTLLIGKIIAYYRQNIKVTGEIVRKVRSYFADKAKFLDAKEVKSIKKINYLYIVSLRFFISL